MRDPHAQEHDDWQDTYLADSLVLLGDHDVKVIELCRVCKQPRPCAGEWEPEPASRRAQRPAPRRLR